jgi:uncharacterized protein
MRVHQVPGHLFDSLASGGGGADGIRLMTATQQSKRLLLLRGVLESARTAAPSEQAMVNRGYDLLSAVQRHDAEAAKTVLAYPSVSAWAVRTLRVSHGSSPIPGAVPTGLCSVAAAAAARAGLPAEIEVPVTEGRVVLPSLGSARAGSGRPVVRSSPGKTEVLSPAASVELPPDPHQDAPGWSGIRRVRVGELDIVIDDIDPFRMPAAPNQARRLPPSTAAAWAGVFTEAWPIFAEHHPELAQEVAATVKVVVPLTQPSHGVVSSSSPETFGAIALSEPPDPRSLMVTLAHETHHLKLSALLDVVTLTMPDDGRRFYAPWREDPRPVSGLLQGAYAYLGVSRFWRHERHLAEGSAATHAHAEFARWRDASARVVSTLLTSGRLTPPGTRFVQGMERTLSGWKNETVPRSAEALARQRAGQHLHRWQSANGPVPS